jgi:hypothetical protein
MLNYFKNLLKSLRQKDLEMKSQGKINSILYRLSLLLLFLALIIGGFTRIYGVFNYNQFRDDQSRDAFVYAQMSEGRWPTLGPGSSVGGYSLSPIYYYLNFVFSFGSLDPAWQAFPNSLFEFLVIPILFYFILLLLKGFKSGRSWFLAGLASIWWSVFFNDIIFSSMEWNPSSIPFFLLVFVIVGRLGILKTIPNLNLENKVKNNSTLKSILLWSFVGLIAAILTGLHSTTLFTIPVVLGLISVFTIWKVRLKAYPVLFSWLTILIAHSSYIYGEIGRQWQNTSSLIQLVLKPSITPHTIFERIDRVVFNYFDLADFAYFDKLISFNSARLFMAGVLVLAILKFKGDRLIWFILWSIWLVYSYTVSNFWGYIFMYYKNPIWFAPIIFTVVFLNYTDFKKIREVVVATLIGCLSLYSIYFNSTNTYSLLSARFGNERTVITYDMIAGLQALPDNSTLCLNEFYKQPFEYVNEVYTKHKSIKITNDCTEPSTIKLYPKFGQNYTTLKVYPEMSLDTNKVEKVYFENEAVVFYSSKW